MEKLISEFSIGLFFWQSIIFIGLLFLLKKYAWGPILSSVNERENSIKDALKAAKDARSEMENLQSDNQRILKEARAEKEALLKEARSIRSEIIITAKEEAKDETEAEPTGESKKEEKAEGKKDEAKGDEREDELSPPPVRELAPCRPGVRSPIAVHRGPLDERQRQRRREYLS